MLVLGLKKCDRIKVGEGVFVYFLGLHNGGARLGFDAPREVKILREKLVPSEERCVASGGEFDRGIVF